MAMEIWDAYDADGMLTGGELVRGERIPEGLYHLCSEVLVRHTDGEYLLMQRDYSKPSYPGYFEATAGGSALKGEDALECALRELREETGITPLSIEEIGEFRGEETIYRCFLAVTDCDKSSVRFQSGETVWYKWLSENDFIGFINSDMAIDFQREHFAEYYSRMGYLTDTRIVRLSRESGLHEEFAYLMSLNWGIPVETYRESIAESTGDGIPEWYAVLDGDKIVGGAGVIFNDFHPRYDLAPNVCALYVEHSHRSRGIGGRLLGVIALDMAARGISKLYLLTDHYGFYEKYGWKFLCPVWADGQDEPSRMYIHKV